MRGAPLFPLAVGLLAGIVVDEAAPLPATVHVLLLLTATLAAVVPALRDLFGPVVILLGAFGVGGALHAGTQRTISPTGLERYLDSTTPLIRARGVVVSQPRILSRPEHPFAKWSYGADRTAFLLELTSCEGREGFVPTTGRARVTVDEPILDLHQNEHVEVFGRLTSPRPPANPGSFDWAKYNRRQGVVAAIYCDHRESVRRLDADAPPRADVIRQLRSRARALLTGDLTTASADEASLLEAMVIGQRSRLDRRLSDAFIRAGCVHFLAVSGIHVLIVMMFARWTCRLMTGGPRACTLAMMIAVILYAAIAEPRPSILRAAVIALLYCTSRLLGRDRANLNWISAAAIVLLCGTPTMVFDVGFQLSFAAVCGVSYLTPTLLGLMIAARRRWRGTDATTLEADQGQGQMSPRRVKPPRGRAARWGRRVLRNITLGLVISAGAWLAAAPIVAAHFHRLHPWGPISSVLVLPVVTVVMGLGFLKLLVGLMMPPLAAWISPVIGGCDWVLITLVDLLGTLPGASQPVSAPPAWLLVVYYAFLLSLVWRFARGRHDDDPSDSPPLAPPILRCPRWLPVTLFLVVLVSAAAWARPRRPADRLVMTVLSVGAGSATVVELPDGRTILYDAGTSRPYDVGRSIILPFLESRGIRSIDRIYLSHPNLDHYSGVPSLVDSVRTGPVVVNEYFAPRSKPGSPSRHLLDLMAKRSHEVTMLDAATHDWQEGGVRFEVLAPAQGLADTVSTNDTSLVLRLSYAGRSILLTGDIEEHAQRTLLETADLAADVLVLPHHGGVRPSTEAFVDAVGAGVLIRSSHQPMTETLNGLQALVGGAALFNTADVGAVRVTIAADGITVSTMRPRPAVTP